MLIGKQRARLRGMANSLVPIVQIGKEGITPELTAAADEALEARELIKIGVLNNCEVNPGEAADVLSGRTRSEVVQVIGKKFVLYRKNKKKPIIEI